MICTTTFFFHLPTNPYTFLGLTTLCLTAKATLSWTQ